MAIGVIEWSGSPRIVTAPIVRKKACELFIERPHMGAGLYPAIAIFLTAQGSVALGRVLISERPPCVKNA
jgi:hypothetical protein